MGCKKLSYYQATELPELKAVGFKYELTLKNTTQKARREQLDEVSGSGNSYDFGARIYDPRLGRWLSPDPLFKIYPEFSPYSFALNSPIQFKDEDGEGVNGGFSVENQSTEPIKLIGSGQVITSTFNNKGEVTGMNIKNGDDLPITLNPGDRFEAVKNVTITTDPNTGVKTKTVTLQGKIIRKDGTVKTTDVFDIDAIDIQKGQNFIKEGGFFSSDEIRTEENTKGSIDGVNIPGKAEIKIESGEENAVRDKALEKLGVGEGAVERRDQEVTISGNNKDGLKVKVKSGFLNPDVQFGDKKE